MTALGDSLRVQREFGAIAGVDLAAGQAFDPATWRPGQRVRGEQAAQVARRYFPDLLPDLQPHLIQAPAPPYLPAELDEAGRVAWLVEAYVTFAECCAPPGAARENALMRAKAARNGAPQARGARAALSEAARILSGEAWGALGDAVGAGKLPARIAPHSWLLWAAQQDQARRKRAGWPAVERLFAPGLLLSGKALRVFSHAAPDLRKSARAGEVWARSCGIGAAYAERMRRREAVWREGFAERRDVELLFYGAAGCHPDGCRDLRPEHAEEGEKARLIEAQLAAMARKGTWVWGRWTAPAGGG